MRLFARRSVDKLERRGSVRTSVQLTAMVVYGNNSVGCTVRNISDTGAAVVLADGRDIPDEVALVIVGKPARHRAKVVWRVPPLIALRFLPD